LIKAISRKTGGFLKSKIASTKAEIGLIESWTNEFYNKSIV